MSLSKKQRKLIKQKVKTVPLAKLAQELNLDQKEISRYLKKIWRKEKYEKYLNKKAGLAGSESGKTIFGPTEGNFNFKYWLENNWPVLFFLGFLVLAVYLNSLGNDFVSDDIGTIKDHPLINDFGYLTHHRLNLRTLLVFFTNMAFGLKPAFFRLSNILFHLGTVWVIYFLIRFFFKSPVPLITASLFAVHPIITESVTWISGGSYPDSSFFLLASFLVYLWSQNNKTKYYVFSVILYLLALSFSDKVIIFPLILLSYELCFGKLKTSWPRLAPFVVISGFWGLGLVGLLNTRTVAMKTIHYQNSGLSNPFVQIPVAISSYLGLVFWPNKLTLYHSEELTINHQEFLVKLGVFFSFLVVIVFFLKKEKRVSFWLSFFLISLIPTLTPFGISWVVAERYVYPGVLGIFLAIAVAINRIGEISRKKEAVYVLLGFILAALSLRTIIRNKDWKNQDVLWLATAKVSPSSSQNHNNLGDLYARRGELERAIQEFEVAVQLKPNYGDAYHNLANVYFQSGQIDLAVKNYQKALSCNPEIWQSHQSLAAIYYNQQDYESAGKELEKAIEINPVESSLYLNLGILYQKQNQPEIARQFFQKALEIDPENPITKRLFLEGSVKDGQ